MKAKYLLLVLFLSSCNTPYKSCFDEVSKAADTWKSEDSHEVSLLRAELAGLRNELEGQKMKVFLNCSADMAEDPISIKYSTCPPGFMCFGDFNPPDHLRLNNED